MRKKQSDPGTRDTATLGEDTKQAHETKARERSEKEAVARAVLEALSAHDSM